jgi:hypothetical protein
VRGSPLLRAFIAFIGIALVGLPLWRLTHRTSVAVAAPVPEVKSQPVQIEFTLTQPASKLSVRHLGKVVWSGEASNSSAEAEFTIPWPPDGVDLRVQIEWPENAPLAAARVRLTDPEGGEQERSIWSTGPADEVLTFR